MKFNKKKTKSIILLFITLISTMIQVYYLSNFNFYSVNDEKSVEENDDLNPTPYTSLDHPAGADDFAYYKEIIIDHEKVSGTSDLIDFPVLISIIDSDLKKYAQPDGDDIAFSTNNTWLDHEIELFNYTYLTTFVQLIVWVRVPRLFHDKDTIIRMYYGCPFMDSRENPTGVWVNDYVGVWHLSESSGDAQDSTYYDTDGSLSGGVTQGTSGQLDGAYYFDGVDDEVNMGDPTDGHLDFGTGSFTAEIWIYRDGSMSSDQYGGIFKGNGNLAEQEGWLLRFQGSDTVRFTGGDGSSSVFNIYEPNTLSDDAWIHFVGVLDRSEGEAYLYKDGTEIATDSSITGGNIDSSRTLRLSEDWSSSFHFNGLFDEVRLSSVARSADWIRTEYDNQNDTDSFYSIGSSIKVSVPSFNDFEYYKIITIDHTKVLGSSSHVNFPMLVSIFDSDLYDNVQPNGNDIAFTDGITWLDHEIERFNQNYNDTHAQLIAWVRIPSLASSIDTIIYMYYGNPSMGPQENPHNVWDSSYQAVWHLDEDPTGTNPIYDSTSNRNDGNSNNTLVSSDLISTKIGRGIDLNRTDDYIYVEHSPSLDITDNQITLEAWVNLSIVPAPCDTAIIVKTDSTNNERYMLGIDGEVSPARLNHRVTTSTGHYRYDEGNIAQGVWTHICAVYDGSLASNPRFFAYVNGSLISSNDASGNILSIGEVLYIGKRPNYSYGGQYHGQIDELRISSIARSSSWVATEFNNQNDPKKFYSISSAIKVDEDSPSDADNFNFYKLIIIDSSKIPGSGCLTNFSVLISLEDSDLHDDVQSTGNDIAFALGSTWLDHEIELFNQTFNSTHAQLVAWVRIPSLSTSINTIIRMYYGNITMDSRENPIGVWNTNYMGVWHLSESSGDAQDSTSYGEDGVVSGTVVRPSTGQVDSSYEFGTDGTVTIDDPSDGHLDFGLQSFTVSFWINVDDTTGDKQIPIYKGASATWDPGYCFSIDGSGTNLAFHVTDGATNIGSPSATVTHDKWIYIVGILDRNNDRVRIYKDGYEIGSGTNIYPMDSLSSIQDLQFSLTGDRLDGLIDEVRISNMIYSNNWLITEYNNQHDPNNFYSVGAALVVNKTMCKNLQVNAIDLYDNPIANVNISMYQLSELIKSDITDAEGSVSFTSVYLSKYNFTATMTSEIGHHYEIVNITSEAILINDTYQTINLICNVSTNFFNITDIDGSPIDSGWIIVGNSSHNLQNCTIDAAGKTKFWWVNITPYEYDYTLYYLDNNYNPQKLILASGDISTPNYTIEIVVDLTKVNFTVYIEVGSEPVSGVKLLLSNHTSGDSIVNLTTDLDGKVTFRWLITNSFYNYSLRIKFYGLDWEFNMTDVTEEMVYAANFSITAKFAYTIRLKITQGELEKFETTIVSLNPTENIHIKWGSKLKLRALFNVTKVSETKFNHLLGPTYADIMSYQILIGSTLIQSGTIPIEEDYIGRHQCEIITNGLESNIVYIIKLDAIKSGYVIPSSLPISLYLEDNGLILNQSENDDSVQTLYWLESTDMAVRSYGEISEDITIEDNVFQDVDHSFTFSLPDIENHWNLSQITFSISDISWNVAEDDINITIIDPNNNFWMWHKTNASVLGSEYNYLQGWWKGISLNLEISSPTGNNIFKFTIGGSFDGTIDIVADTQLIREKVNVKYSQFNVTDDISILSDNNGWIIKNITFEIYNCYNTSNWNFINDITTVITQFTTNEGYNYTLEYLGIGKARLIIDNITIFPLDDQFFFDIIKTSDIMFNVNITVEYYQGFYWNQHLENISSTINEQDFTNGGDLSLIFIDNFADQGTVLLLSNINNGSQYFFPSELTMNITIEGQKYNISNTLRGEGTFSLAIFNKDKIFSAFIETNQLVNFTLSFRIIYSRIVFYETTGTVTYIIREAPDVYGTVQYYENLGIYQQTINTSLINTGDYTIRFTVTKDHYISDTTKDLKLEVQERLTLISGSSVNLDLYPSIYVQDSLNFTFLYTDELFAANIINLDTQSYTISQIVTGGQSIPYSSGNLITNEYNQYILDVNTETLDVGRYSIWIVLDKQNYQYKQAILFLTVNPRIIDYELGDMFEEKQTSVVKGKTIILSIELTDSTRDDSPLTDAEVLLEIGDEEFEFDEVEDGVYELEFETHDYEAFFTSNTITGTIKISKANYTSEEVDITIVIEMEEIDVIPGVFSMPFFYFLILIMAIIAVVGSLATYSYIQLAKIPKFVKKIRSMKGAIKKSATISESISFTNKDTYMINMVRDKWGPLGLSFEEILGIKAIKGKTLPIIKGKIAVSERSTDLIPRGLILMRWDERIGTEVVAKYPEDIEVSQKTLMQIYGAHEYTGESGMVTLMVGSLNIASYYTGQEKGYYLVLLLNVEDDADTYEGCMLDVLQELIKNLSDDSYMHLIPSLFRRLAIYPTLNNEQHLIITYQDDIKRRILNRLRDEGVIAKSELLVWLKDQYKEGFIDLDAVLNDLVKKELIKQVSVKGMASEQNFFTGDLIMLRIPPVKLVKNPEESGLPSQLTNLYFDEIKKFFEFYHPTEEDNNKIINTLVNPQIYQVFQLLRSTIATYEDLEKLKKKGVDDISKVLKSLWDANLIKVFQDKAGKEYYALQSDFLIELVFPKYVLQSIKNSYEQRSQSDKVLIEFLNILEDTYLNLK
jgi:hypothetical protein